MTQSQRSPRNISWEKKRCDTMAKSPSHGGEMEGFYLIFWLRNYPHATGTRPGGRRPLLGEAQDGAKSRTRNRQERHSRFHPGAVAIRKAPAGGVGVSRISRTGK